jgi:putative hydroxymethylpyrimidine transport system permease protein
VDLMFAALFCLAVMALALYFLLDWSLRRAIPWLPDSALTSLPSHKIG